jgi:hypothetical protein
MSWGWTSCWCPKTARAVQRFVSVHDDDDDVFLLVVGSLLMVQFVAINESFDDEY